MNEIGQDVLSLLIKEGISYKSLNDLVSIADSQDTLANIPIQPLYSCIKNSAHNEVAEFIPKLNSKQRQIIFNLDLWKRDNIDPEEFGYWIEVMSQCKEDSVREEFVTSIQFLLYLKSVFNIYTFDVEDPQYPDHDNYFLTEDSQLLFEFHESYPYVDQIRGFIRELYGLKGVEYAYTFIFKILQDAYMNLLEEEYQFKKSNLEEYGFVDYFDGLQVKNKFPSLSHLNQFIENKKVSTPDVAIVSSSQSLQVTNSYIFNDLQECFSRELSKVGDEKRNHFLHFDFIRFVNSLLVTSDVFKKGSTAHARVLKTANHALMLGFDYVISNDKNSEKIIFEHFSFQELYKIGYSLVAFIQKSLVQAKIKYDLKEKDLTFLGENLSSYYLNSMSEIPKFRNSFEGNLRDEPIDSYRIYQAWTTKTLFFLDFLDTIKLWQEKFESLNKQGKIQDSFYLNYQSENINLESLLITEFYHSILKTRDEDNDQYFRLGLSLESFKKVTKSLLNQEGKLKKDTILGDHIENFQKLLFSKTFNQFEYYFIDILQEHLEGYEFVNMQKDDFKHVGGPILLF